MKKVLALLTAALAAAILLTACGGGGGGGGGATAPPPRPPAYLPEAEANFGVGSKVVPVDDTASSGGFGISKTPDGLVLNSVGRQDSVTAADFRDDPTRPGFITAVTNSSGRYTDTPTLSYTAKDTVVLGGKKLGLSHADFGMWDAQEHMVGTVDDTPLDFVTPIYTPFTMGDPTKTAAFPTGGSGSQTFSGTTVAGVDDGGPGGKNLLTGTAALTVNLGNLNDSNLNIDLNNYAEFDIDVGIDSNGVIAANGNTYLRRDDNADNLDWSGTLTSTVKGQFYGDSPNAPSEGVGSYHIKKNGVADIYGGFGVKKP